ncbi:hypothetical protein [Streptomyces sp. NPDC059489]|uniref:TRADD-N-associated membrane domain-containing protein n=1 Tax=Streptomyces sp. NPDC059489 TaxID=3346849 RepID=UPI0036880E0E
MASDPEGADQSETGTRHTTHGVTPPFWGFVDRRTQARVLGFWATPPFMAIAIGAFAYSLQRSITVGVVAGLCTGLLYFLAGKAAKRRADLLDGSLESRRRVLEAERELEDALRRPAPLFVPPMDGTGGSSDGESQHPAEYPSPAPLGLPELWKVTHRRLDHYHETVLGQARQSFRSAQIAMWVGFILLGGFVVLAVRSTTTAGTVVAGALGAVSAALAGYVSRTFVKSQETAAGTCGHTLINLWHSHAIWLLSGCCETGGWMARGGQRCLPHWFWRRLRIRPEATARLLRPRRHRLHKGMRRVPLAVPEPGAAASDCCWPLSVR